jgi:hypothetical protein
MVPAHVSDVLKNLSREQQNKFAQLLMWAGDSGIKGSTLPIDYDRILDMVVRMGASPVEPIPPPPVIEEPLIREKQKV